MYEWRKMTDEQQRELLAYRRQQDFPPHSPPHFGGALGLYHVTAANYEHAVIIGRTPARMAEWTDELRSAFGGNGTELLAWCVLPNHYHLLLKTPEIKAVSRALGTLHGRASWRWNAEDGRRGRQCWCKCADRALRSERHRWATLNYIHQNPVHHAYCARPQDWPFSSFSAWMAQLGVGRMEELWREYPVLDYGKGWDEPGM